MKKVNRKLSLILAAVMVINILSGCSAQNAADHEETCAEVSETAQHQETSADDSLLRDNYYLYVNQDYINNTEIPLGEGCWGYFDILTENNNDILDETLQEFVENRDQYETDSDEQKIADFYLTLLDTDTRDTMGLGAYQDYVDGIRNSSDVQEFIEMVGKLNRDLETGGILEVDMSYDCLDSSKYSRMIYGCDLILGKETLLDERFEDLRPDYEKLIGVFLQEAGYTEEESAILAPEIIKFQTGIAPYGLDLLDFTFAEKYFNVYSEDELEALFSNVDIGGFLKAAGLDGQDYQVVCQPELCEKINEALTDDNLDFLKAYECCCLMYELRNYLSMTVDDHWIEFRSELFGLNGVQELTQRARDYVLDMFGFEFGKVYVDRCFSEQDKQMVTEMVENIVNRYRERIMELDWMADTTKETAINKLDHLTIQVGYPDEWPEYYSDASLTSPDDGGTLIDNLFSLKRSRADFMLKRAENPVDRNVWEYPPQEVNAFCDYSRNAICIPAGILQTPFYSTDAAPEENYGGIGVIIGHEITHDFDSSGALYDADGNYNPWWTEQDKENFDNLTQEVIDYYDTFELAGRSIVGAQTVNENIADLGSIGTIASFFEDDTEALDRMFRNCARVWAEKDTDEYLAYLITSDEHAPNEVRINAIVKTLDCFYETYPQIQEGDEMYLPPEDRVKIW